MRLTVFQSDKGDCMLLTSADGARVLIDGGMRSSYGAHVAPALARIREAEGSLDLVYVSHIDQDHILGVLQLFEDLVAWRVHDYQLEIGNEDHPEPANPRPPEVVELWHNAFHEQVGANAGPIEDMLAATAAIVAARPGSDLDDEAISLRDLTTAVGDGIELSRRAGAEQLRVPVNAAFGERLALVRPDPEPIAVGSLRISVIGPRAADLERLRGEWNRWLEDNEAALAGIRERLRVDADRLGANEVDALRSALTLQASELGQRGRVTAPNLASLMLLVEEGERTILLTGDGHSDDILAGLEHVGRLDRDGEIHVDVLKVQHHGSEHNIDPEFCRRVTADHYVFCGNGSHENPDPRAIEAIIASRLGDESQRSSNPEASGRFKLWFNSSAGAAPSEASKRHLEIVEALVSEAAEGSGRRMSRAFLTGHAFELEL